MIAHKASAITNQANSITTAHRHDITLAGLPLGSPGYSSSSSPFTPSIKNGSLIPRRWPSAARWSNCAPSAIVRVRSPLLDTHTRTISSPDASATLCALAWLAACTSVRAMVCARLADLVGAWSRISLAISRYDRPSRMPRLMTRCMSSCVVRVIWVIFRAPTSAIHLCIRRSVTSVGSTSSRFLLSILPRHDRCVPVMCSAMACMAVRYKVDSSRSIRSVCFSRIWSAGEMRPSVSALAAARIALAISRANRRSNCCDRRRIISSCSACSRWRLFPVSVRAIGVIPRLEVIYCRVKRGRNQSAWDIPHITAFYLIQPHLKVLVNHVERHTHTVQALSAFQLLVQPFLQRWDVGQVIGQAELFPELAGQLVIQLSLDQVQLRNDGVLPQLFVHALGVGQVHVFGEAQRCQGHAKHSGNLRPYRLTALYEIHLNRRLAHLCDLTAGERRLTGVGRGALLFLPPLFHVIHLLRRGASRDFKVNVNHAPVLEAGFLPDAGLPVYIRGPASRHQNGHTKPPAVWVRHPQMNHVLRLNAYLGAGLVVLEIVNQASLAGLQLHVLGRQVPQGYGTRAALDFGQVGIAGKVKALADLVHQLVHGLVRIGPVDQLLQRAVLGRLPLAFTRTALGHPWHRG